MSKRKKKNNTGKMTFGQVIADLDKEKSALAIDETKLHRLEEAIKGISEPKRKKDKVPHQRIYNPVSAQIVEYKKAENKIKGSGVTLDFLTTLYQGVQDAGDYIVHISARRGLPNFRKDISTYLSSFNARLEYMDSLVDVTNAASDSISKRIDSNKSSKDKRKRLSEGEKTRYRTRDVENWRIACRKTKSAVSYLSKRGNYKPSDTQFQTLTKDAYSNYQRFSKITYEIIDRGLPRLNDIVGKILWPT